jgi:hypothetical protein
LVERCGRSAETARVHYPIAALHNALADLTSAGGVEEFVEPIENNKCSSCQKQSVE